MEAPQDYVLPLTREARRKFAAIFQARDTTKQLSQEDLAPQETTAGFSEPTSLMAYGQRLQEVLAFYPPEISRACHKVLLEVWLQLVELGIREPHIINETEAPPSPASAEFDSDEEEDENDVPPLPTKRCTALRMQWTGLATGKGTKSWASLYLSADLVFLLLSGPATNFSGIPNDEGLREMCAIIVAHLTLSPKPRLPDPVLFRRSDSSMLGLEELTNYYHSVQDSLTSSGHFVDDLTSVLQQLAPKFNIIKKPLLAYGKFPSDQIHLVTHRDCPTYPKFVPIDDVSAFVQFYDRLPSLPLLSPIAPPEWKERILIAQASDIPLIDLHELVPTHADAVFVFGVGCCLSVSSGPTLTEIRRSFGGRRAPFLPESHLMTAKADFVLPALVHQLNHLPELVQDSLFSKLIKSHELAS